MNEPPSQKRTQPLRHRARFGTLLVLVLIAYVLMALMPRSRAGLIVLALTIGMVILVSLEASDLGRRWVRIGTLVIVATEVGVIVSAALGHLGGYALLPLIVISPMVVMRRVLRAPTVTTNTLLGAVCAYVLLGLAFAALFTAMDHFGGPFFAQPGVHEPVEYVYFSLITLTTTGFGDLTPGTDAGRMLVSIEAVVGTLFVVTFLATLVSRRTSSLTPDAADDEPEA